MLAAQAQFLVNILQLSLLPPKSGAYVQAMIADIILIDQIFIGANGNTAKEIQYVIRIHESGKLRFGLERLY